MLEMKYEDYQMLPHYKTTNEDSGLFRIGKGEGTSIEEDGSVRAFAMEIDKSQTPTELTVHVCLLTDIPRDVEGD